MKWIREKIGRDMMVMVYGLLAVILVVSMTMYVSVTERITGNEQRLTEVDERISRLHNLWSEWKTVQYDVRGYVIFGDETALERAVQFEEVLQTEIEWFESIAVNREGRRFATDLQQFHDFYYGAIIPITREYVTLRESGEFEENFIRPETLIDLPVTGEILRQGLAEYDAERGIDTLGPINRVENSLKRYEEKTMQEKALIYEEWRSQTNNVQYFWMMSIVSFVLLIVFGLQPFLHRQSKLLNRLAMASDQLVRGEGVDLSEYTDRQDEIGVMARSFREMAATLRENGENLLRKNDKLRQQRQEMLAQQELLMTQQTELEQVLEQTKQSQRHLVYRNELTETLAGRESLTAYPEIIEKLIAITESEIGALVFLDEQGSYSITSHGLSERLTWELLDSDQSLVKRANRLKKTVQSSKKVTSDHPLPYPYYMHEVAVPVFDPTDDAIIAFIYLVRYETRFTETQMDDVLSFARQLSLSLLRMRLFEEMTREKQKTEQILDSIREAVVYIEHPTNDVFVNKPFYEMFPELGQFDRSEPLTKAWSAWSGAMGQAIDQAEEFSQFAERLREAEISDESMNLSIRDGEMDVQMYIERIMIGGLLKGTLLVFRDVTSDLKADRLKSDFISTISHELRTPLSSIFGFTELMIHKRLPQEKQQVYLETIHRETERLTELVNDFLDIQRMESGIQRYTRERMDIEPVVYDMITFYESSSINHQFEFVKSDAEPFELWVDGKKFKQLLSNLLSNAVKYSPKGGKIRIELARGDSDVQLSVQDEGIGIPSDAIVHLFDKFYRVDNSDSREIGGTGLGLPICQEIVRGHGGQIHVDSVEQVGSTFTVVFPTGAPHEVPTTVMT